MQKQNTIRVGLFVPVTSTPFIRTSVSRHSNCWSASASTSNILRSDLLRPTDDEQRMPRGIFGDGGFVRQELQDYDYVVAPSAVACITFDIISMRSRRLTQFARCGGALSTSWNFSTTY